MFEWWNSLSTETLRAINMWGQILGILCTAGLVVSGYLVFTSSGRLSELAADGENALREHVKRTEEKVQSAEEERRPRTVAEHERDSLSGALAKLEKGRIDIESIVGDMEGDAYGNQFEELFNRAGWQVTRARGTGNHGIQPGVRLIVPATAAGQGIAAAFARSGFSFTLEQAAIDYVWLRVGTKPLATPTK